nr:hypothetical protein [Tanacetum cinerariifolium]
MESVKKLIDKRALHKREYDSWVNERQMQTIEEKVDTSKALDASLVDTEREVDQNTEQCHGTCPLHGKSVLQPHRNQSVVRQPTAFKSERPRISKPWFSSQVDVNNDLPKPVTTHYLPRKENLPLQNLITWLHLAHLEFPKEVNSRAKVPSNKTVNINKPIEQRSFAKKPKRQIPKGHMFSIKKTFIVHEKTMTHRSCLRWKRTSKIFKTIGLRWVPTGKIFTSSTTKVDSEPSNGSNEDITNPYECEQTLNVSGYKEFKSDKHAMTSDHNSSKLEIHDNNNEPSSSKLVLKVVPLADKTATS